MAKVTCLFLIFYTFCEQQDDKAKTKLLPNLSQNFFYIFLFVFLPCIWSRGFRKQKRKKKRKSHRFDKIMLIADDDWVYVYVCTHVYIYVWFDLRNFPFVDHS